ncbi:TatD family hydrolase [Fibrobacter sp. UWB7]|uniref:TatD family hydrolase n=1 Tax=Fibrobacter sp. UWB7 TaxID=1896206 RepID=UPI00091B2668|nr:TatD family hydrolase [Fibrobacter sp. UWB7]SHM50359.1 TatD DNase family protein [Fibrobacter sp. UWB7]
MFDFHIHLARLPQKKQLTQLLLDRNYDFIAVSCEPWEWEEVSQLKKEFSTEIKPFKVTYGIHPMIATQVSSETLAQLRTRLEEDPFAMVGEAGIDKRYPGYNDGTQDQIFLAQAGLALELKRDLQIHCVGDYMHVLKLLEEAGFESVAQTDRATSAPSREAPRPIFHRFGGDANFVRKALPYGALFSLHEDSFRKKSTAAAIKLIPESNVFFETDADESFLEPAELLEELEGRLESVRLAYAKSLE